MSSTKANKKITGYREQVNIFLSTVKTECTSRT